MEIKIYSTPPCPYCKMAKDYFASRGVSFQDFDVSVDEVARKEMVELSGQLGVPVIVINGEVIVGFDRGRIDALLGK